MESKIIKEKKNPFLDRTEFTIKMTAKVTPTITEVKKAIGKDDELTVVKKISTNFGKQAFSAKVYVYDNAESKEKIETIPQKVRKKMAVEKKAAEEAKKKEAEAAEEAKKKEAEAAEEAKKKEAEAAAKAKEEAKAAEQEAKTEEKSKEDKPEEKAE
jgi:ribosomal protein S24E